MSSLLVVAQLPPPVHGSNVMAERFLAALEQAGHRAELVEKSFSRSMTEVGRASLRKALMVPALCRRLELAVDRVRPDCCVFFISVGITSLLVDCLLLSLLRRKKIPGAWHRAEGVLRGARRLGAGGGTQEGREPPDPR